MNTINESMLQPPLIIEESNLPADPLEAAIKLRNAWLRGELGGSFMPEDARPSLKRDSDRLWHYFTLGMALNYQRNSYNLWEAATAAFQAHEELFNPEAVSKLDFNELQKVLVRFRVALQPNRHVEVWQRICCTLSNEFDGSIRNVLHECRFDVERLIDLIQKRKRRDFPNLGGNKIFNYWLHVMEVYCGIEWHNRGLITIAPDTHVMQSSARLGLIPFDLVGTHTGAQLTADAWCELLRGTRLLPIDMHTPLWLWSRGGFPEVL